MSKLDILFSRINADFILPSMPHRLQHELLFPTTPAHGCGIPRDLPRMPTATSVLGAIRNTQRVSRICNPTATRRTTNGADYPYLSSNRQSPTALERTSSLQSSLSSGHKNSADGGDNRSSVRVYLFCALWRVGTRGSGSFLALYRCHHLLVWHSRRPTPAAFLLHRCLSRIDPPLLLRFISQSDPYAAGYPVDACDRLGQNCGLLC